MKNKLLSYILILLAGIIIGGGAIYLIAPYGGTENHIHEDEEGTLYSCGMHPDIIEKEPGNCPICGMKLTPIKNTTSKEKKKPGERKILYWRAPMNPNEIYDAPGKSKMGMDLVPVYEDEGGASGVVTVDGSVLQSMNVKMDVIKSKSLSPVIYTNGYLDTDETKEYSVTTKIDGWIENLYVNYTGQKVKKGQKLVDIYSPDLVAAQQELLTALNYNSGSSVLENAKRKLELFDVSKEEIDNLIKTKKVKKYVTLYAPFNGTVITKNVLRGDKIKAGKEIMKVANLNSLWLMADIYERDLDKIKTGNDANIYFTYKPGKVYKGKISFIYPTVDPVTRTVKVRINLDNRNNELKPSMFANVEIFGNKLEKLPVVPETAVIRRGKSNIVILSLGDGKFKPVEITLGQYSQGYYQVLNGLKENDMIVVSGQFMLDSESSLRAAVKLFSSAKNEMNERKKDETMDMETDETKSAKNVSDNQTENIIRKGIIDVEAIDKNGDGKVYQDPMDWNVISDKEGRCPVCGMYLKEVTIEEAKKNLKEHGFEYK